MDTVWRNLRYAVRSFRRSPGLVAVASLSLALGIASNVTIFTAINRLIWNPLTFPEPDRLVQLWGTDSTRGFDQMSISVADFLDWRRQLDGARLAANSGTSFNFAEGDRPERIFGERVSAGFFEVLSSRPMLGRGIAAADETPGAGRVVVLSHRFWSRRFGSDSALVGRAVLLDGEPYQVAGVMPPGFRWGDNSAEVFVPLVANPGEPRGTRYLRVIGRLDDGVPIERLGAALVRTTAHLAAEHPASNAGISGKVIPMIREVVEDTPRQAATITMFAVLFVLLIACANVANLLLARAAGRDRELAVRSALGADRTRLITELMTESMVLAAVGGLLGLGLSFAGIRWLRGVVPADAPGLDLLTIDWVAFGFAVAASATSGLLFGIAPALRSAKPNLAVSLRDGGRGLTGLRHGRMLAGLVGFEVALALVLLISAGLLIKGSIAVQSVEAGFDYRSALSFRTALSEKEYPDSLGVLRFQDELRTRLAGLEGVTAVGATSGLPFSGGSAGWYLVEGEPEPEPGRSPITQVRGITPGYLQAIGVTLKRGRDFNDADRFEAGRVMLINETLARRHWLEREPLGNRIRVYGQWWTIVGVVQDTREFGLDDPAPPVAYLPVAQSVFRRLSFVVKTSRPPADFVPAVREEVRALAPAQPIYEVKTMEAHFRESLQNITVMPTLLTVFGAMALLLAVIGVYGVIAYAVAQRTQEMGIRRALGAGSANITRLVLAGAMTVCGIGAVVGVALASLASRGLATFLYGVSPFDPVVFGGVTAALLGAAFAASLVPAHRATRVDPIVALRAD
ncbi:MAG: ABC transporter permease [Gemmatimonadetes bacterium]|nr:ABC transporter permease [Gemmatimonadota bacterium]